MDFNQFTSKKLAKKTILGQEAGTNTLLKPIAVLWAWVFILNLK
jgi:hypothetical protein